ncbi:MAG: arsenosugar biosynthesis-associated peroxidase-like protein [Desulfobacteraceae bacterium]|nr:arsenosugar biosynthesis-associated peroxidase-like protein [Desulfobacteraceae bacterium]
MKSYYNPEDLDRFEEIGKNAPELAKNFFDYYAAVFADGALTEREKSLIALAVAHAVQCPYCIDAYTKDSLEKGSNLSEMTEAVDITGGAPELNPHLEYLVESLSQKASQIMLRSNLSALGRDDNKHLIKKMASRCVTIVASFPSLDEPQINAQRGDGVFKTSIDGGQTKAGIPIATADHCFTCTAGAGFT